MSEEMSHLNEFGQVHMVDVGGKDTTDRMATAEALVVMAPETSDQLFGARLPKGVPWPRPGWPASWLPSGPPTSYRSVIRFP